jgi:TolA-binding protein
VEASLCLQQVSYYRAGDLGMLSGVPHVMLHRMPESTSSWRAWALLIDADALASQGRYEQAQASLEMLETEFPQHPATPPALQLLAWIYAQQGDTELAIVTQDRLLSSYGTSGAAVSLAVLNRAHILFNEKKYEDAAAEYEAFVANNPESESRPLAMYQAGICYLRLERDGDAVDRFDMLTNENPTDEVAEQAWLRAGDVYFRAGHYEEARRCYDGLLENFAGTKSAALVLLRIAQCDYNAGRDAEAIAGFSRVTEEYPDHRLSEEARRGIEQALYRLAQSGEGEETLASLVEQFPSSTFAADAQFEIAARRYDSEDWAGAADAFRRVITQFPDYSSADRAQYLMADALRRSGDEEAAKRAYDQFATFFPNSELIGEVRLQVGANHFEKGDYMRAAIDFASVLDDSVATPEIRSAALYNLALCRRMLDDNAGAQEALEEYAAKYPGDQRAPDVHYQLAEIYDIGGRTQDAADHYLKSLEAGADPLLKAELYYRLGAARETLEDIDGAIRAYAGAKRQKERSNPFRLTAIVRMAAIYEERGETDKAVKAYKDLIKNATDDEVVVAAKARVDELEAAANR